MLEFGAGVGKLSNSGGRVCFGIRRPGFHLGSLLDAEFWESDYRLGRTEVELYLARIDMGDTGGGM